MATTTRSRARKTKAAPKPKHARTRARGPAPALVEAEESRPIDPPIDPLARIEGIPMKDAKGDWSFVDPSTLPQHATLLDAQQALIRRRAAEGLPSTTLDEAQTSALWHASEQKRKTERLEDVLAEAAHSAGIEIPKRDDAAPPRRPRFPIERIGEPEGAPGLRDPEALQLARMDAGVPDSFMVCPGGCPYSNGLVACKFCGKRFVHLTWKLLAGLVGKSGLPAVRGVETVDGDLLTGAEAVAEIQARMSAHDHVVLLGEESRVGKSVSAAAFVDAELRAGAERIRWMSPFGLRDNAIDRALGAKTIILDDIGEEMSNAPNDTGILAQRSAPITEVIAALSRARGKRLIITTFLNRKRIQLYGGGVTARIYDGAHVIQFRPPS